MMFGKWTVYDHGYLHSEHQCIYVSDRSWAPWHQALLKFPEDQLLELHGGPWMDGCVVVLKCSMSEHHHPFQRGDRYRIPELHRGVLGSQRSIWSPRLLRMGKSINQRYRVRCAGKCLFYGPGWESVLELSESTGNGNGADGICNKHRSIHWLDWQSNLLK